MELFKPNASEEFAKDLLSRLYGFQVLSMKRMKSYDDQNFHIQVSQTHSNQHIASVLESGYTLKITNTEKSAIKGHFDTMHATMVHLHQKGLRVPVPVKNINGTTWSLEKVPLLNEDVNESGDKLCGVHLLTFLPGMPISSSECSKDLLYEWGVLLGEYHNAAQDMVCPGLENKYVLWNLENIPKINECMHVLPEEKKQLVYSVLNRYEDEIKRYYSDFPTGFIHGDFNENNVLVHEEVTDQGSVLTVGGVLDFEDVHKGMYVWDVAVMMMYSMLVSNEVDDLDGAGHALAGYLTRRSFNHLELSSLKMCIECRFCQSLVYGAYSFSRDPENQYLLSSSITGWAKLKKIISENKEDLQNRWKDIAITSTKTKK